MLNATALKVTPMPGIILHHYPQSPVSEKVRVVLGIKGLAWRSVTFPRVGYRIVKA